MPLADAVAIGFSKSFFVTVFAIVIFLLRPSPGSAGSRRFSDFIGVLVMTPRLSTEGLDVYALLSLISAAAAGLIMVIIRRLAQKEQLTTVMAYQSIGSDWSFLLVPAVLNWVPPTGYPNGS